MITAENISTRGMSTTDRARGCRRQLGCSGVCLPGERTHSTASDIALFDAELAILLRRGFVRRLVAAHVISDLAVVWRCSHRRWARLRWPCCRRPGLGIASPVRYRCLARSSSGGRVRTSSIARSAKEIFSTHRDARSSSTWPPIRLSEFPAKTHCGTVFHQQLDSHQCA